MSGPYQPWYKNQTYPSWDVSLNTDDGAENLTGVDITKFTMIFHNTAVNPAVDTTGTGTFSIKRLFPGEIFYKPSPSDVASAFNGNLIITAEFPPSGSSTDLVVYDPIPFVIT